jgi:hypothetical protein
VCGPLMMGAPLASDEGGESGRLSVRVQSNTAAQGIPLPTCWRRYP